MRFIRRKSQEERLITCPSCCQLVPADALECSMCHADLRELPVARREAFAAAGASRKAPGAYR